MPVDAATLQVQLERWAVAHYDEHATVTDLRAMPGHAGLSFGFTVRHGDGSPSGELDRLVIRMPPAGVRRSGNTDVMRQVPLLQALRRCGVPVAELRWWDDDEQWFGVPFFMVGLLPGSTYAVREPDPSFHDAGVSVADIFMQAIDGLAKVHLVDWHVELPAWQQPIDLADEVRFWDPLLAKSADPTWRAMGERTRDMLLASVPHDPTIGIFHGDFQTNNLLFHEGRLAAILDWEISGIGAQLLDLGWLIMMNDAASWFDREGLSVAPPFDEMIERYASAARRSLTLEDVSWYRALSGYRFGVISCFNVMLHRSGKRTDPEWDLIAPSIPRLFGRAAELLGG